MITGKTVPEKVKAGTITSLPATPKAAAASGIAAGIATIAASTPSTAKAGGTKPPVLSAARDGKPDDLKLIWGVGEKLEKKFNDLGIWHFDQIAKWTPAECAWIEANIEGMQGRLARDRWLEQCQKLASGWRPEGNVGERPKG